MSNPFSDTNPYASPAFGAAAPDIRHLVKGKVTAPAIALIIVGSLGLLVSLFNVGWALTQQPVIDPNAPEFLRNIQQGSVGVFAASIQSGFAVFSALIIAGAAQMLRMRAWGFALAASIMAMLNCTSGCCILGLPIGIWSLVILLSSDVQAAFRVAALPQPDQGMR